MAITVQCECGKQYSTPEANAGKSFACKRCGKAVTVPGGHAGPEVDEWVEWARKSRRAGASRGAIRKELVEQGFSNDEASALIEEALGDAQVVAMRQSARATNSSSGGFGWLIWIGVLVLFNVLSAVFDWGWIVY